MPKINITESPMRVYQTIPTFWAGKPTQMKYHKSSAETHYQDGWRDLVTPILGPNQKIGAVIYDQSTDLATWEILDKSPEEITAARKAAVPFAISKLQAMLMLGRLGIKSAVLDIVANSDNQEVKDYFEYAATWERSSPIINRFAPQIGMDEEALDGFFIEAEKIN